MEFIQKIIETIQNNQLLAAGIGLSGAGIITFWVKDVPRSIYAFLKRELTTELTITSQNIAFHNTLKWIEKKYKNKNFRKLKLTNGKWGWNENTTTSIGYGIHWIRYNKKFFLINLVKESANQSEYDKETLTMMKIGRSREIFDNFVKEIETLDLDVSKTKIYKMDDAWSYAKDQKKRNLNSIFIEKEKKDLLINNLSKFINNEQWYIDNGIPYQLGILLYGSPGTGKTSLIKAIAGYLNYPIYYLSPKKLGKIESAMSTLSDKCIVVIEDIDSNFLTHSRENKDGDTDENSLLKEMSSVSLSEILNSLDGMFSAHGRILVATTNHIENLDAALIRPGRIDLKIEIGYVNNEILKYFINNFFPHSTINFDNLSIKPNLTVATLQNFVLQGNNENEIVKFVTI
jgi:chaperone BCS1